MSEHYWLLLAPVHPLKVVSSFIRSLIPFSCYFQFVAHPNVQQLLASIWYDGLPGFLQMNMVLQFLEVSGSVAAALNQLHPD